LNAGVSEGVAIYKLVEAIKKIESTRDKLESAKKKRVDAELKVMTLRELADRTAARALALDEKGLTP
jgi:hypothetical protein